MSPKITNKAKSGMVPISVVILTYNEELNIEESLKSVAGWAGEIFIVDSGSEDETVDIAARYGVNINKHNFETHSKQWSWALKNLPINNEWILGLDADQRLTSEIREEIGDLFETKRDVLSNTDGFYINRRQVFRGKWIKHGGYYPKYLLKLFKKNSVVIDENDLVDHHFYVNGNTAKFKNDLIEQNHKEDNIYFWTEKHNRYARLLASDELNRRDDKLDKETRSLLFGNPDERTLWTKGIWGKLPLYVRPFIYFIYRYFFRLGFLDGKNGFVFHFLQAFWFRLLVDINIEEMRRKERE